MWESRRELTAEDELIVVSPRISLREEQKRSTRTRIVQVAIAAFERSGYSAVSVSELAAASNVNRATFYLHFSGKAEVLQSAMQYVLDTTVVDIWRAMDIALVAHSRPKLRDFIEECVKWWVAHSNIVSAWEEAMRVDHEALDNLSQPPSRMFDYCGGYLAQFESEAAQADVRRKIELLMLQLGQVGKRSWMRDPSNPSYDAYLNSLTDIWCSSLRIDE